MCSKQTKRIMIHNFIKIRIISPFLRYHFSSNSKTYIFIALDPVKHRQKVGDFFENKARGEWCTKMSIDKLCQFSKPFRIDFQRPVTFAKSNGRKGSNWFPYKRNLLDSFLSLTFPIFLLKWVKSKSYSDLNDYVFETLES